MPSWETMRCLGAFHTPVGAGLRQTRTILLSNPELGTGDLERNGRPLQPQSQISAQAAAPLLTNQTADDRVLSERELHELLARQRIWTATIQSRLFTDLTSVDSRDVLMVIRQFTRERPNDFHLGCRSLARPHDSTPAQQAEFSAVFTLESDAACIMSTLTIEEFRYHVPEGLPGGDA